MWTRPLTWEVNSECFPHWSDLRRFPGLWVLYSEQCDPARPEHYIVTASSENSSSGSISEPWSPLANIRGRFFILLLLVILSHILHVLVLFLSSETLQLDCDLCDFSECSKVMWKWQRLKMARILNKEPAVYKKEQDNFLKELRKFHDSKGWVLFLLEFLVIVAL